MCDYSLENVASRAARVGETLVSYTFTNSITRGFTSPNEPGVAVCLLPGTELAFDQDVICDHPLGLYDKRSLRQKTARFRKINENAPYEHHDALEFPDGRIVLLSRLTSGQRATVLQLPAEPVKEMVEGQVLSAFDEIKAELHTGDRPLATVASER